MKKLFLLIRTFLFSFSGFVSGEEPEVKKDKVSNTNMSLANKKLKYVRVQAESELPEISYFKPFMAVVVIKEEVSNEWRNQTSDWLVDSGCLYMMAWGRDCSLWDDSVDWAILERWDYGDIPDEAFVMTSWHEKEPISEVFFFAKHCANHQTGEIKNILILHIGLIDKETNFESIFLDA